MNKTPLTVFEIRRTRGNKKPAVVYATNTKEKRNTKLRKFFGLFYYPFDRKINL